MENSCVSLSVRTGMNSPGLVGVARGVADGVDGGTLEGGRSDFRIITSRQECSAERERLMAPDSLSRSPLFPVSFWRSEPARSTKESIV